MISIDQVLLLEEKVESAVKKIEQLNAENAALRSKCAELSNALNAKSEQFSTFQSDQSKIEEGILKALSRLNAVENVVLQTSGAVREPSNPVSAPAPQEQVNPSEQAVQNPVAEPVVPVQQAVEPQIQSQQTQIPSQNQVSSEPANTNDIGFEFGEAEQNAALEQGSSEQSGADSSEPKQPMFDIF